MMVLPSLFVRFRQADDLAGLGSSGAAANVELDLHGGPPFTLRWGFGKQMISGPWQQREREP